MKSFRENVCVKFISVFTAVTFLTTSVAPASAQSVLNLPPPGSMIHATPTYVPAIIKGLTIDTQNPFHFDFIVDSGDSGLGAQTLKPEAEKLVKYFLAALTVPEDQKWVNLSPYEKDRIIPDALGTTDMGRDMLAQDYMLKQLTASMMHPDDELGKKFWERVYAKAQAMYGTTDIPMNTFNKIWIVPSKATVYEYENSAFVVERHLKVYLEQDYVALQKSLGVQDFGLEGMAEDDADAVNASTSDVVREVLIPEIEKEVNEGQIFANLRQIYNAMILATWYRRALKESLLGQIYANQNKTAGIENNDPDVKNKIYQQYLEAFQKGAYDLLREDYDSAKNEMVVRKYFSGGTTYNAAMLEVQKAQPVAVAQAMLNIDTSAASKTFNVDTNLLDGRAPKDGQINNAMLNLTPRNARDTIKKVMEQPGRVVVIANTDSQASNIVVNNFLNSGREEVSPLVLKGSQGVLNEQLVKASQELLKKAGINSSAQVIWGEIIKNAKAVIVLGDDKGFEDVLKQEIPGQTRVFVDGNNTEVMDILSDPLTWKSIPVTSTRGFQLKDGQTQSPEGEETQTGGGPIRYKYVATYIDKDDVTQLEQYKAVSAGAFSRNEAGGTKYVAGDQRTVVKELYKSAKKLFQEGKFDIFAAKSVGEKKSMDEAMMTAPATAPDALKKNIEAGIIPNFYGSVIDMLAQIGQLNLTSQWDNPGINDDKKTEFLKHLDDMDKFYPGGLAAYVANAKRLLEASKEGKNPFEGMTPEVPPVKQLTDINEEFDALSLAGLKAANKTAFVLVAGGVGDRLGYKVTNADGTSKDGIKVGITVDLVTQKTYLQQYAEKILAMQNRSNELNGENRQIPFVIMTSDQTHADTIKLLEDNDYFGLNGLSINPARKDVLAGNVKQIIVIQQAMVPSIKDWDANFILDEKDPYVLQAKPHGHGDIHQLVYMSGLSERWSETRVEHSIFIQDTNINTFNGVLPTLGMSVEKNSDANIMTTPREPGEATGSIVEMKRADGTSVIQNVEYNEIKPLLKALRIRIDGLNLKFGKYDEKQITALMNLMEGFYANQTDWDMVEASIKSLFEEESKVVIQIIEDSFDVADPQTGKSLYPANLNIFILKNKAYKKLLNEHQGIFGEFVNPKGFAKPTRLETMMQDILKYMGEYNVAVTNFAKRDVFSPVKNSIEGGKTGQAKNNYPDTMATGENDYYKWFRKLLALAGVEIDVEGSVPTSPQGINVTTGAKVVLSPRFAVTVEDVRKKVSGENIEVGSDAVVSLDGEGITLGSNVKINGALVVKTAKGVNLKIHDFEVQNKGWSFVDLTPEEMGTFEFIDKDFINDFKVSSLAQAIERDQKELKVKNLQDLNGLLSKSDLYKFIKNIPQELQESADKLQKDPKALVGLALIRFNRLLIEHQYSSNTPKRKDRNNLEAATYLQIRGYKVIKNETAVIDLKEPGNYELTNYGLFKDGQKIASIAALTVKETSEEEVSEERLYFQTFAAGSYVQINRRIVRSNGTSKTEIVGRLVADGVTYQFSATDQLAQEMARQKSQFVGIDGVGQFLREKRIALQKANNAQLNVVKEPLTEEILAQKLLYGTNGWRDLLADKFNIVNVGRMAWAIAKVLIRMKGEGQLPKSEGKWRVIVGYDARPGSRDFARRVIDVLAFFFKDVDFKFADQVLTTPAIIAMTKGEGSYDLGLHITASHNAPVWNGLKIVTNGVIAPDVLTDEFAKFANDSNNYLVEIGGFEYSYDNLPDENVPTEDVVKRMNADYDELFPEDVIARIKEHFEQQGWSLTVDAMHGSTNPFLPWFKKIGAKVVHESPMSEGTYEKTVTYKNAKDEEVTEDFRPEPLEHFLSQNDFKYFKDYAADGSIYIALDGDGDRMVAWVKRNGQVIEIRPNALSVLFSWDMLENGRDLEANYIVRTGVTTSALGKMVAYFRDVKSQESGLDPKLKAYYLRLKEAVVPVGSKHFAPYVEEGTPTKAATAFEKSGHQYNNGRFDDAVQEALKFLQIITESGKHPAEYVQEIYNIIGYDLEDMEDAVAFSGAKAAATAQKILDDFGQPREFAQKVADLFGKRVAKIDVVIKHPGKPAEIMDMDTFESESRFSTLQVLSEGVIITFTDGSVVPVRKSGTEPKFRVYAEDKPDKVLDVISRVKDFLKSYSDNASLVQVVNDNPYYADDDADLAQLPSENVDAAMNAAQPNKAAKKEYGGINLNDAMLDLSIKRDGKGMILPVLDQPIEELRKNIPGFTPVIINIRPIANMPQFLSELGKTGANGGTASADPSTDKELSLGPMDHEFGRL